MFDGSTLELTRRQETAYTHRCSLFSVGAVRTIDPVTFEPREGEEPVLVAFDVPCLYTHTPNINDPAEVMRIKREILFTADSLELPLGVEVRADYFVINTSTLDGKPSANFGEVHRIDGPPQVNQGATRRPLNKQHVQLKSHEKVQDWQAAYIATARGIIDSKVRTFERNR